MRNDTRKQFEAYREHLAHLNGVPDASTKFAAAPSVEQTLERHIQESSAFLQQVNSVGVDQQSGEKVGLSISQTIAGRTDTSSEDRKPADVSDSSARGYTCEQTNFDTALPYAKLDAWAHKPEFQTMIRDMILRQQALDRIMIGFNGTQAAATTDRTTNTMLEDVNVGWIQKLRDEASQRVMTEGATAGEIQVGHSDGDYRNLDALVYDMRSSLLGPWYARNTTFMVLAGPELVDEKYFPMVEEHGGTPTEARALDLMISNKRLGGLRVAEVPFFPERTLMVTLVGTDESNLSIYYQRGSRRRMVIDNPKRDRVENYESVNEAYVIEDLSAACAAENIKLWDGTAFS
ncbi:phage major capsid protein, P2 family [Halorhodospira neutriphila]|uniref:Phage major capsid protein, P2 family n=1 Tax=Halorhodospira neutriphila TaxID=168379 RepID=A0ABS1E3M2_9GAMM|nr:phage major capsid protein, P2 family [Halorhodospira neutriphila]MBK1725707.1 phage major capsid protein, P2 family [Halorhodospira neutriphila]